MDSVALAANMLLIVLLVAMFADGVRGRLYTPPLLYWGIAGAAVLVTADGFLYLVTPAGERLVPPAFYAVATVVVILRTITVTAVGLAAAERLGIGALPLLRPRQDRHGRSPAAALGAGVAGGAGVAVYSVFLFLLTGPAPPDGIGLVEEAPLEGAAFALLLVALMLTVLGEELTFRLGIQNWLAAKFGQDGNDERRYWAAITLSAALWSAGHIGILEPDWIKLAQIFPAGLLFGWLFRRFGFEAAVAAHGVLNLIMPFVTHRIIA